MSVKIFGSPPVLLAGTKRVHNNIIYNEYISDRQHIHMNATRWETLTEFTKWLGREGKRLQRLRGVRMKIRAMNSRGAGYHRPPQVYARWMRHPKAGTSSTSTATPRPSAARRNWRGRRSTTWTTRRGAPSSSRSRSGEGATAKSPK